MGQPEFFSRNKIIYIGKGLSALAILSLFLCISCALEGNTGEQVNEAIITAYMAVLEDESGFFSVPEDNSLYFTDYLNRYYPGVTGEDLFYAILDMDGDGTPELLLKYPVEDTEVLHFKDGVVYGHNYSLREMNRLKNDGTFTWSNSAFHNGYGRYLYDGAACELVALVQIQLQQVEEGADIFLMDNVVVTKETVEAFYNRQEAKDDVIWRPLTAAYKDPAFAQFH